jgi:hypothetical protein
MVWIQKFQVSAVSFSPVAGGAAAEIKHQSRQGNLLRKLLCLQSSVSDGVC